MSSVLRRAKALRRRAVAGVLDGVFFTLSRLGRLHPQARPERHGVEVVSDRAYLDDGRREHLFDLYRPTRVPPPWPVVLYVHGGGFRTLSKDSHWMMGLAFARRGFLVANISYRLAPHHPFPAALEDTVAALSFLAEHAAAEGGDMARLVLAGESAGANLVTALTVALCYPRPEPLALRARATSLVPCAVLPACGMLQVSDPQRLARRRRLPTWIVDELDEISANYLGPATTPPGSAGLADPLLVLESDAVPDRPLPPFFVGVGTRDPLLDDSRRLRAALDRRGVRCELRVYEGGLHAFHAVALHPLARRFWRDAYSFLDSVVPERPQDSSALSASGSHARGPQARCPGRAG